MEEACNAPVVDIGRTRLPLVSLNDLAAIARYVLLTAVPKFGELVSNAKSVSTNPMVIMDECCVVYSTPDANGRLIVIFSPLVSCRVIPVITTASISTVSENVNISVAWFRSKLNLSSLGLISSGVRLEAAFADVFNIGITGLKAESVAVS